MNKYFVRDTPLAELERMMMAVPNFAPRGSAHAVLCHYQPQAADVDCRNCLQYRRGCRSMMCLYLTERLQAGTVTVEELIAETVRHWKHPKLNQRAIDIAHRVEGFHFEGQLHIARMLRMAIHEDEKISSRWMAAIYLLSAHGPLWQQTLAAVTPGQIDFSIVKLSDTNVQDYVLYRAAKGIYSGTLGATSEELADPELVGGRYAPANPLRCPDRPVWVGSYEGRGRRDMIMKATLHFPQHPEHGIVTVSFPIPQEEYDHTMELLEGIDIGDALRQDCQVAELDSQYPVLHRLEGTVVNVDELDYLAKRLDSFCDGEDAQFLAMAHKLDIANIEDFIDLTFCCQQATVITNFADLEKIGKDHMMTLNGGTMPMDQFKAVDGRKEALRLIQNGSGTITPFGVVYDNGMALEQLYDGRHFPSYLYGPSVMAVEAVTDGAAGYFCLPMSDQQLQRALLRAGFEGQNVPLTDVMNELPEQAAAALDMECLTVYDLDGLNRLCRAIEPMNDADREKLNAVVQMADTSGILSLCQLAENLEQFDFIPGVHTPEEYGRYMIQQSGHFEYDENLEDFYDYALLGERCVREESGQFTEYGYAAYHGTLTLKELLRAAPAEQYRQEQGMQMGGLA